MSETINDQNPSVINDLNNEQDQIVEETGAPNADEDAWFYKNSQSKSSENETGTSYDDAASQEIDTTEKPNRSLIIGFGDDSHGDDDDDDDGIQVTIGNYEPDTPTFQNNRQKSRPILTGHSMIQAKSSTIRGVDIDAQGIINGQSIFEHDVTTSYKDDEKPWKKPGADITDYFNYGFTEETWTQYCERQRRIRAENNLARINVGHMPPVAPMIRSQAPMMHPMNPHTMMMMNMQMVPRPINTRKPDGKIGVIGSTDQTSRRLLYEPPNNFERPPYVVTGVPFPGNQPSNGQTVGDLIPPTGATNHGAPPNSTHSIQTLGAPRLPMMNLPQYRPPYPNPQFFPRGPIGGMHADRHPQPYFIPSHSQPGTSFLPPNISTNDSDHTRDGPSSRSPTPEHRSSQSSTPEENRSNTNNNENDKSTKEKYRDHHRSSSSSSKYRSHHRSNEHEYERPRNERDDRHSRKRYHHDEHESSRHHRSSARSTPSKRSRHRKSTEHVE